MFLLIDKPKGITSHDVVDEVRKITGERRVGHGGTLDPNATGLLIVGVGRDSTKKLSEIAQNTQKTYEAEIVLGEIRDTDDSEGVVIGGNKNIPRGKEEIEKVLQSFHGEQQQTPPQYSAIKLRGRKAYELARSGQQITLKPRTITIYDLELISYAYPIITLTCIVSSGTYIRALARDIGEKLGCGAYLKELRRTRIGNYDVTDAVTLAQLRKKSK